MTPSQILKKATDLRSVFYTQSMLILFWFFANKIFNLGGDMSLSEIIIIVVLLEIGVAITQAAEGIIRIVANKA